MHAKRTRRAEFLAQMDVIVPWREAKGRKATPSVAIVDAQSAKTALKGGRRGFDAGKKIKGRKRHIAVDSAGNLLAVIVHSAGIQDRVAARAVLMRLFCRFDSIGKVFVDGGYTGTAPLPVVHGQILRAQILP